MIAPFFAKKNNKLRLVLDCRGVNRRFLAPPPMVLSAGSTWSQVVLPDGQQLYVAQNDVKDYFYSLSLPEALRDLLSTCNSCTASSGLGGATRLCLPCRFRRLGLSQTSCCPNKVELNWAMWISQRAHQRVSLQAAGIGVERLLVERPLCPDLSSGEVILIPYADNLNVASTDPAKVQEVKDKVLRRLGFRVREETEEGQANLLRSFQSLRMQISCQLQRLPPSCYS